LDLRLIKPFDPWKLIDVIAKGQWRWEVPDATHMAGTNLN
jgi:hypothetical protein